MEYNAPVNIEAAFPSREPVRLNLASFKLLRGFGAFDDYWKAELLDGELWGVPADGDQEPESDATFPIKLTISHYELLARSGAFDGYRKTELIDGRVYPMSPQYRPHGFVKDRLAFRLQQALEQLRSDLTVATEQSMAIPHFSEPQPDIMLTSEAMGEGGIPVTSVALIVEVSDSTARYDLRHKAVLYAVAGVAEYWVADINTRIVHRLWTPIDGDYTQRDETAFGQPVAARTIDGLAVETNVL